MIIQWVVVDKDGIIVGDFYSSNRADAFESFVAPEGCTKVALSPEQAEQCRESFDRELGFCTKRIDIKNDACDEHSICDMTSDEIDCECEKRPVFFRDVLQSDGKVKRIYNKT